MATSSDSLDYGRFDELAEEFAERYRRGERPSLQEYVDRLPQMADEIREMFPALVEVERADGEAHGVTVSPAPPVAPHLSQIGDYRIVREVGRGGMGVVYEAEQISLGRRVALKILPGHAMGDRKTQERFRREAKAAARLHHTNIVPVYEVGRDRDVSFYAMQLIQGQGLDQVIEELQRLRGPVRRANTANPARSANPGAPATVSQARAAGSSGQQLAWMAESLISGRLVSEALGSPIANSPVAPGLVGTELFDPNATSEHVVAVASGTHRQLASATDVSSSAVMPGGKHVSELDTSGRRQPFFRSVAQIGRQAAQGLAHAHARGIVHRDIKPSNLLLDTDGVVWITDFGLAKADDDGMTASGDILGTLRYMAPERFRGGGDARADIFALGLTLYELLTLRPAYDSTNRLNLIEQIKNEEPDRPRSIDRQVPRDLETIVLKAIAKEPQQRYPSADAMAEDLRRFLADEPIKARQISTSERYWRWARRNPLIAVLGGVLTALLITATVVSVIVAARFASLANDASNSAAAEHGARIDADQARATADEARDSAETARTAAQSEAYRAMLSEVKALRAGRQLGWREEALANLARLAVMPTSRRDLAELRTEAVASLGEFGVKEVARLAVSGWSAFSTDFSPDSRTLVTTSGDGNLDLWDVPGRSHLRRLAGLGLQTDDRVPKRGGLARFLPAGDLAFLSADGGVAFRDPSGGPSTRPPITREKAKALKLRSDLQGRWLAVWWNDGHIDIHDAVTGDRKRSFPWKSLWDFAFSPDGEWLALQKQGGDLELVPTSGQGSSFTLPQGDGYVPALAFSPDGGKLASVDERAVLVWDLANRQELLRLTGHKETVTGIAFSPDGSLIATSCGDATTRIWDARDGRPLTSLPGPGYQQWLAFSPNGEYLSVATDGGLVCLYQVEGLREQRRLIGHRFGVHRLVFHPSLPRLASSSDDHEVMLWDPESAKSPARWIAHIAWATGLAISPDGSLIASARGNGKPSDDFSIRIWNSENGTLKKTLPGKGYGFWSLAFDPKARRLASGDTNGNLMLFEVDTGRVLRSERLGSSNITSVAFLDGGRSLLVGLELGGVALIDLEKTGPLLKNPLPDGCTRLVVDTRTNRAIVGDSKGSLIALSLPDLEIVHRLDKGHDGAIPALALSPDGRILATGGKDRRVVLRDPETFKALVTFPAWTGPLKDLAFDATGRWLAMAGTDSEIGLWDLGLVHDELAAVRLAWDQTAPSLESTSELTSSGDRPDRQVPVIRAGNMDPAELEKVGRLVNSGVAAFEQGQIKAAFDDLQQASDRLQAMRRSRPGDPVLARMHGISLGFLGSCLRDLKRPAEALARTRESLAVYESMRRPGPGDTYNMACGCSMISVLDARASANDREKLQARAVGYLRGLIEANPTQFVPQVTADRDLDPLRNRDDYRDLMADASFPRDPFLKPEPGSAPSPPGAEARATLSEKKAQGFELLDAGRTLDGLAVLASVWASDPKDTSLLITVAALQAWLGKDAELEVTCRRALEFARGTEEPTTAERTAKILSLRPSADKTRVDAAHALSHRAVELGRDQPFLPYFQMARGMAEYRSGHHDACQQALNAALGVGNFNPVLTGTSEFYLAMSLFREGKDAEARQNATQAISRMKPLPADENNPFANGAGPDDLILWMAYKEARTLLKLEAAPTAQSQVKPDR